MGLSVRTISLLTLVVQNSALVLMMRYSRIQRTDGSASMYLASTAVVMCELLKTTICLGILHYDQPAATRTIKRTYDIVYASIITNYKDSLKLCIPAILYMIQNNLQYLAVTLLDAATFQVTYQMKILTTALFSVLMLNRNLGRLKWLSLIILTLGIAVVQIPPGEGFATWFRSSPDPLLAAEPLNVASDNTRMALASSAIPPGTGNQTSMGGLLAVGAACVLSGLAGVYFEKVLKGSDASLWIRNIQLSIPSCIFGLVFGAWMKDGAAIASQGFFQGYSPMTWAVITCQAVGGLIVAVVVKYADNILKGFATSISILLSCLISVFLFNFQLSAEFAFGAALVIYASYLYGLPTK